MFSFITHKNLLVNLIVGLGLLAVIVFSFFGMLNWFTEHGKYEKVPNVTGKGFEAARVILESKGFTVEVGDSIFDITVPRLHVMKQTPEPEALVKNGRTVYLTINRLLAPQVEMPNLIGFSLKSAEIYLSGLGLSIGDTTYKPDIAKNSVLSQSYNGNEIKPGTKISVGSRIGLVIGSGIGDEETDMPDLIGLTYADALSLLGSMRVNLGTPILLESQIKDTLNAFIVKQSPTVFLDANAEVKTKNRIRQGQIVDVWLSLSKPIIDTALKQDPTIIY